MSVTELSAAVDDVVFAKFRDLIYREAGIALTDMKKALLVGRLAGRLRELGRLAKGVVERPSRHF